MSNKGNRKDSRNKKRSALILSALLAVFAFVASACNPTPYSPDDLYGESHFSVTSHPENLKVTSFLSSDEINLTWDSVEGATSYLVERTASDGTFEEVGKSENTAYSDISFNSEIIALDGYEYEYRVSAFSEEGLQSQFSETETGSLLYAPSNIAATKGSIESIGKIKITWSPIEGIDTYRLFAAEENAAIASLEDAESLLLSSSPITIDNASDESGCTYIYTPTEEEENSGVNIMFALAAVSPLDSDNISNLSTIVVGYALSDNAPLPVESLMASEGVSNEVSSGLTVTWEPAENAVSNENMTYLIYRASEGGLESQIQSPEISSSGNTYTFKDTSSDLETGVMYTYTVIPVDGSVKGQSSSVSAFFLSGPNEVNISSINKNEAGEYGYGLSFSFPVGLNPNDQGYLKRSDWKFTVYGIKNTESQTKSNAFLKDTRFSLIEDTLLSESSDSYLSSATELLTLQVSNATLTSSGYSVSLYSTSAVNITQYNDFRVTVTNSTGVTSMVSPGIAIFNGLNIRDFQATSNYWDASLSANSNGVYPVVLSFTYDPINALDGVGEWYRVEIKNGSSAIAVPSLDSTGMVKFNDTTQNTAVGVKYTYTLNYTDIFGNSFTTPLTSTGYGSITDEELIGQMEYFALKPWEHQNVEINKTWSSSKIYKKISAAGLGSLDVKGTTENASSFSNEGSGSVTYVAKAKGLGGDVTLTYSNFGVVDYIQNTGGFNMIVSMSQNGTAKGTPNLTLSGMYPAVVTLENISVSSGQFVGYYSITQTSSSITASVSPNQSISNNP